MERLPSTRDSGLRGIVGVFLLPLRLGWPQLGSTSSSLNLSDVDKSSDVDFSIDDDKYV